MSIKKYKRYRKVNIKLNHKIMDTCVDKDAVMESGRMLGILHKGILVFESKYETNILMDFVLNEYRVNNKSPVQIYREKIGWKDKIEKKILDALLSSYTSLFKITSIVKTEKTVILSDILNNKDNIKLIDIAFSESAIPGLLMFIRLVSFKDFNMASGVSFVFPGNLEKYLLRKYNRLSKKIKADNDSIKRYIAFFRLNRIYGIEVIYE